MSQGPALLATLAAALLAVGCSGPLLANEVPPVATPSSRPTATPRPPPDPQPLSLPADDGPHTRLTEWWYYTGHLETAARRAFGFELVAFRAERGRFPLAWAAHLALTDEAGSRFLFDQRSEVGQLVDRSAPGQGFDLSIAGDVVPGVRGPLEPWRMSGAGTIHELEAPGGRSPAGTRFGLTLRLDDGSSAAVLHHEDGWIDFGAGGGSYYYSRPRMAALGTVTLDDEVMRVSGSAWFDHQWGDFISVGGGWDWFAVNLDDGTDLTVSVVRDPFGRVGLVYGTLRDEAGVRHLEGRDISHEVLGEWTSPSSRITWPAGWRLRIGGEGLEIELRPTLADQELDTRSTTGVIYWEGSQHVTASRDGMLLGGRAYVELTGYAPATAS